MTALVLSLVFIVACIAAVSHLAYGTASASACIIGLLLFATLATLSHLLAFALDRATRATRALNFAAGATAGPRGFEVKLPAPRLVLPAERPPP